LQGNLEKVKNLLEQGASPNVQDNAGNNLFTYSLIRLSFHSYNFLLFEAGLHCTRLLNVDLLISFDLSWRQGHFPMYPEELKIQRLFMTLLQQDSRKWSRFFFEMAPTKKL
jgi:ankyrin repeat protein